MRLLVTGGAGFIGSWLSESLLEGGHEVLCLDNLSSGDAKNIAHLKEKKGFTFYQHDTRENFTCDGNLDFVLHLASRASPPDFYTAPIEILLSNSQGTENMLNLAREKGAGFLLASTSEVYGNPKVHPQPETYWGFVNSIGVRSCYDEGKRFAEALTMAYHRKHKMDVRIIRIFNTYGPRLRPDDGRLISNLISQALRGEPLTVYGDGKQTRSFCYASDLVGGIKQILAGKGISGEVFNLGMPKENTVLEVAKLIKKLCKTDSEIVFKPLPKDDPVKRQPDTSKIEKVLGWRAKVGLEEGLQKTIEWYRSNK